MSYKSGSKLVRDLYPDLEKDKFDYQESSEEDIGVYSLLKLGEEIFEFLQAQKTANESIGEMSDILQILEDFLSSTILNEKSSMPIPEENKQLSLEDKLAQQLGRYANTNNDQTKKHSIASNIIDILKKYAKTNNISWDSVLEAKSKKSTKKGDFKNHIISVPKESKKV